MRRTTKLRGLSSCHPGETAFAVCFKRTGHFSPICAGRIYEEWTLLRDPLHPRPRGETFNVGIVIWNGNGHRVAVDEAAAKRAAKENPLIARNALGRLASAISSQLKKGGELTCGKFERMRANQSGIPFVFAEPCFVSIAETGIDPLEAVLQRLLNRIVRPRAVGTGLDESPTDDPVKDALWPLIAGNKVRMGHQLRGGKSGTRQPVDYFTSNNAGAALDVLHLERKSEGTIGGNARAEAFKVMDLKESNKLGHFYVLCRFSDEAKKHRANDFTRKAIASVGGEVVTRTEEAAEAMKRIAG